MAGEVALRLLLKGQKEVAAGLADVTKQTGSLGKAAKGAAVGTKELSGGLDSIQKQGLAATRTSKALIVATRQQTDALQAAAAASKQAADVRLKAATALADATAKQTAGDVEGAKAAKAHADALTKEATAATRMATAMRASAAATKDQVVALRASETLMTGKGPSGRSAGFGALARVGGALTKTGLAVGAYTGYEGVKRAGSIVDTATRLTTLANVPKGQVGALQKWAISSSPGLREDPNTILTQMYRIASASPGHPYSPGELESLTRAAAMFSVIGGPGTDPEQAARIFGIIRANGGLGTKNFRQIGGIATSTIGSGDMTANDYVNALGVGGLAVNAARHKINLTQLGGMLAEMGDLGVTGSRAGTSLQRAISLLSSPSKAASGIYSSLGISPTMIDQVIRTKGMSAGMALLQRQLTATMPANMVGQTASVGDLRAVGYSRKQALSMQKAGPQSMEDLLLTRAFGGARQSVPIIALLNGLNRTQGKTAEVARTGSAGQFNQKFGLASTTPAQEWKRFDLDLQQLENNIGLKLIPKLEAMGNWLSRNETAVKDVAEVLGVLAIPAVAAYAASLTMKGITAVSGFSSALRGQNTQLSQVGGIASAQSRGIGMLGTAVMGVTAAVGVWELGKATASHGAGGAVAAGLGGAVTGMTIGLQVGGPWGAAIGAAGGALIGLAGHFLNVSHNVHNATLDLVNFRTALGRSYQADQYKLGAQTNQTILGYLGKQSVSTKGALAAAGVNIYSIDKTLKSGKLNVGAGSQLQAAARSGVITQQQETLGLTALQNIAGSFGLIVNSASTMAVLSGQVAATTQQQANALSLLLTGTAPSAGAPATTVGGLLEQLAGGGGMTSPRHHGKPKHGLGGLLNPTSDIVIHNHLYVDGKHVQESVHRHDRKQLARQ
jgi:hypothetical protein